jgi:hypothetical protein
MESLNDGSYQLQPGQATFLCLLPATDYPKAAFSISPEAEEKAREKGNRNFSTTPIGNPRYNFEYRFDFARIRATESIYKNEGGYMHGPVACPIMPQSGPTTSRIRKPVFCFFGRSAGKSIGYELLSAFLPVICNPHYDPLTQLPL